MHTSNRMTEWMTEWIVVMTVEVGTQRSSIVLAKKKKPMPMSKSKEKEKMMMRTKNTRGKERKKEHTHTERRRKRDRFLCCARWFLFFWRRQKKRRKSAAHIPITPVCTSTSYDFLLIKIIRWSQSGNDHSSSQLLLPIMTSRKWKLACSLSSRSFFW